jgi:hypothetical protein
MGVLYTMCQELTNQMEQRASGPMDVVRAKGELSVSAGFMVGLVGPNDVDDPAKIDTLRRSAQQFGYTLNM